jgi:hypothetical protein
LTGGGGVDGFADLGDFACGDAAQFGMTTDDGFVLGEVYAESFVGGYVGFLPLNVRSQLATVPG